MTAALAIAAGHTLTPAARELIAALLDELAALYPEEADGVFPFAEEEVAAGRGTFLVAYSGGEPVGCGGLRTVKVCAKAADSYALARKPGPWMVLAGAGMCSGGRILHHLRNHLPDPTTLLLMVGYQSRGSLGRALSEGARDVKVSGQRVAVRAQTHVLGGLSGHAGQSDLLNWVGSLASSRPRVILTHGEDVPRKVLQARIHDRFGLRSEMPAYREVIEC